MKKGLLATLYVVFTLSATAQIVEPLDYTTMDPIDGEIWVTGEIEEAQDFELTTKFHIENISGEAVTIQVRRIAVSEVEGSTNKFCWAGVCYTETDDFSLNTITMNPGDVFNSDNPAQQFKGYYYHNGNSGMSTINYRFTDVNDNNMNATITVNYAVEGSSGVSELNGNQASLASPVPNPVSDRTSISFDFGTRPSNGRILINNMMGQVVKEIPVEERQGLIFMDVYDLSEGIYLYSLNDGNQTLQTKRLVVSK